MKASGPKGSIIWGAGAQYSKNPTEFIIWLMDEYPGFSTFRLGFDKMHFLGNPEHIEHVLITHPDRYKKGVKFNQIRKFLGDGLLTNDFEIWRSERTKLRPFFSPKHYSNFFDHVIDEINKMLNSWEENNTKTFSADREFNQLMLNIIGRLLFDSDYNDDMKEVGHSLIKLTDQVNKWIGSAFSFPLYLPTPHNLKFKWHKKFVFNHFDELIKARSRSTKNTVRLDILQGMMDVYDFEKNPEELRLLKDEIATLYITGQETSALALIWTIYLVASHPEIENKLITEIEDIVSDKDLTYETISQLKYTRCIIMESLRLYPSAWLFGREAIQDDVIGGYEIKKGENILISPFQLHRNPSYWDQPDVFDPERFNTNGVGKLSKIYIPFGSGPRTCIGNHLAMTNLVCSVALIYSKFKPRLVSKKRPLITAHSTIRPKEDILFTLEKR